MALRTDYDPEVLERVRNDPKNWRKLGTKPHEKGMTGPKWIHDPGHGLERPFDGFFDEDKVKEREGRMRRSEKDPR